MFFFVVCLSLKPDNCSTFSPRCVLDNDISSLRAIIIRQSRCAVIEMFSGD